MRSKGLVYFYILSIFFLFFFYPTKSIAATSKCLKNLHMGFSMVKGRKEFRGFAYKKYFY